MKKDLEMSPKKQREIRTREITESDFDAVADFLANGIGYSHKYFLYLLQHLAQHPTPAGFPKYGRLLESDGAIVGAIILMFSSIYSDGIPTIRCRVTGWSVLSDYRCYAALFFAKDLKHDNVTYLNTSAKADTAVPIIEAQGFTRYVSGQFIAVPALQFASGDNQAKVVGLDDIPTAPFAPFERDLLLAHRAYGCICFWCVTSERAYPFVFRRQRSIPVAQLIYCSDIEHFVRFRGPIGRFLAWRGTFFVRIDSNGPIPGLVGMFWEGRGCRYYKGPKPRIGDLAYTDLAMCGWATRSKAARRPVRERVGGAGAPSSDALQVRR
jgi:hypothetical protein